MIEGVRFGPLGVGASRIVLTTKSPFKVERFDILRNKASPGYRLIADLTASSKATFEQALAAQVETTGSTLGKDAAADASENASRKFTVVIDPGHGGVDGGANGSNKTVEKTITLLFGLELKKKLLGSGNYDVFLTREDDRFLRLDERVAIARGHGADLLISIHADTIRLKGIHGATVYTVADKASDEVAKALADRENLADRLGGFHIPEENLEVADILIDLIRRETHQFSIHFARSLIGELSGNVDLINNPHRFAGFRVLRAPDIPSVLVELGYLSNVKDEAHLRDPVWRERATESISRAVAYVATARLAAGG